MLNLYPLIATKPDDLPKECDESIHGQNLEIIKGILSEFSSSDILLCYGGVIKKRKYLKEICLKDILKLCKGRNIKCLGATKEDLPKHPSRISTKTKIIEYSIDENDKIVI